MMYTSLLLVLLPFAAKGADDCAQVGAKVGPNNVKTVKKFFRLLDHDEKGTVTEDKLDNEVEKQKSINDLFAGKMSCMDAPAGKDFGYPGFDLKDVKKEECSFANLGVPKDEKVKLSPWEIIDISWDQSLCGKRVWSQNVHKKAKGPGGTAKNLYDVTIWDFNDDGEIVGARFFEDTNTLVKVFKMHATLDKGDETAEEKEWADASEEKWAQGTFLPSSSRRDGGNLRDAGFLVIGLTVGVFGMRLWSWAARARGNPVGYTSPN